ncbi:ankyrin repeat-containing domain protein [Trichoderma sp. SZMC 28015]
MQKHFDFKRRLTQSRFIMSESVNLGLEISDNHDGIISSTDTVSKDNIGLANEDKSLNPAADGEDKSNLQQEVEMEPDTKSYGLLKESSPKIWQEYDVVVVHGIHHTRWTTEDWQQNSGSKSSTLWISNSMGFDNGRILHFHYQINDPWPGVLHLEGLTQEAQKLLDGLSQMRREFDDYSKSLGYSSRTDMRPIIFIAHDVGGIIVKRALYLAAMHPDKYREIPYNTTHLIFLGCPHRGTRVQLEDSIARLLLLPGGSFRGSFLDSVSALTKTIMQVNCEFIDTKMLIRASVYNIYNDGNSPGDEVGASTRYSRTMTSFTNYLDIPFEYVATTSISHLDLVVGDETAIGHTDNFVRAIRDRLNKFPYYVGIRRDIAQYQKILLALSPPIIPPNPNTLGSRHHDLADCITGTDRYNKWIKQPGMSVLNIEGPANMRLTSENLFIRLSKDSVSRNILYFAFRRHDHRFNTVGAMLTSLLSQLISRHQSLGNCGEAMKMLFLQRAWSQKDLLQLFDTFHGSSIVAPTIFFIACLDECDESYHQFLELLKELESISEKSFKFIITTSIGSRSQLKRAVSCWPVINLLDITSNNNRERLESLDQIYDVELKRLFGKKPVYHDFRQRVLDILANCGNDYDLGLLIIRWLANNRQADTRARAAALLKSLSNPTPQAVLETILSSFESRQTRALNIISWITFAFEPPTLGELAVAVKMADEAEEDDLHDIEFDDFHNDILQFGQIFFFSGYEIESSDIIRLRELSSPEEQLAAHAKMASICIRYLRIRSVMARTEDMCGCYGSETPVSRPKQDLISYAVTYWWKHYELAGNNRPTDEAKAFLEDKEARRIWAEARCTLSNPVTRLSRSYLSPLPIAAMVGMSDFLTGQIETEKAMPSFSNDTGLALIEAVRNGHSHTVRVLVEINSPSKETLKEAVSAAAAIGDEDTLSYLINLAIQLQNFDWPPILYLRISWLGFNNAAKLLLDAGVRIPEPSGLFWTSTLHLAAEGRHSNVMRLLLSQTLEVDALVDGEYTPLHIASYSGDADAVEILVNAGARVDRTSVNLCIENGKPLALKALISAKADLNHGLDRLSDDSDFSMRRAKPLQFAAMRGYFACVKLLIDSGADIKATLNGKSALWHAICRGHLTTCRLLLEKGADPNEHPDGCETLLELTMSSSLDANEKLELFELLVQKGVGTDLGHEGNISHRERNALLVAVKVGNYELVKRLMKRGILPDSNDDIQTPLYLASFHGHTNILRLLLDEGADVDKSSENGWTPLHAAYDNPTNVKLLLSHDADINAISESGSIIHLVAKHNKVEVLSILLSHNTRPNLELLTVYDTYTDMTALCIACILGHADIMKLLLQNGANVNHRTLDGSFPLEFCFKAAATNSLSVIDTLLEFRPDLSQADNSGNTILHNINSSTPLAVIKLLYTAGSNVLAINKKGETALGLAVSRNKEAARFFISRGVNVNTYTPETGTILTMLAAEGDWELFKTVIDGGGNIHLAHERGFEHTLLCLALSGPWGDSRQNIVRYLLESSQYDPNIKCNNGHCEYPIFKAVAITPEATTLLLQHGANMEVNDTLGRRPMHISAFRNIACVKVLLSNGADPMPRAKTGMTPLHFASAYTYYLYEYLELLEGFMYGSAADKGNKGSDLDEQGSGGGVDISLSMDEEGRNGYQKLDVNDADDDGWTPLMWAAKCNYTSKISITELTKRGADLWITGKVLDSRGYDRDWSPLKVSRYFGSREDIYEALIPLEKTRVLPDGSTKEWDDKQHITKSADWKYSIPCTNCLTGISGFNYQCLDCKFNLCYKCFRSKTILHPGHRFEAQGPELEYGQEESEQPMASEGTEGLQASSGDILASAESPYEVSMEDLLDHDNEENSDEDIDFDYDYEEEEKGGNGGSDQ